MALPRTPSQDSWPDEILAEARGEFWGAIDIYTPGAKGTYDPTTGKRAAGSPDILHIDNRPARIQRSGRLPVEANGAYEWSAKQRYIFQIEMLDGDPLITEAMRLRVRDGGRFTHLTRLSFQITAATDSDHAPLLTIKTVTETGVVGDGA